MTGSMDARSARNRSAAAKKRLDIISSTIFHALSIKKNIGDIHCHLPRPRIWSPATVGRRQSNQSRRPIYLRKTLSRALEKTRCATRRLDLDSKTAGRTARRNPQAGSGKSLDAGDLAGCTAEGRSTEGRPGTRGNGLWADAAK